MKLWKHQKQTLRLLKKEPRVLDTSDPGVGKTLAHLAGYEHIRKTDGGKALIIAPKTLLDTAWGGDIDSHMPHLKYSIAYATNREEAFEEDADIYLTNTDATKWLAKQKPRFFEQFSTLVVDEAHYFKHHTSQRSKALKKIRKYFDYRRLLSATITANSICDIWHPMLIVDDGESLGQVFSAFRSAVTVPEQVGPRANHIKWVDKEGAEEAVSGLIKDISIRHEFDEVMDIPENRTHFVTYRPNNKLMRQYRELEAHARLVLEEDVVVGTNAAILRDKLLQVASGAVYSSEGKYGVVDMGRYELIADLIEGRKHSVVFTNWIHQREELAKLLKKRKVNFCVLDGSVKDADRKKMVNNYQSGFYQTMLLHYKTGAHGLTLTKGTSTIFSSPMYMADYLKQAKHRIYRGGQTEKTETILVEAEGTVERLVYERLQEKSKRMTDFLDILKAA